MEKFWRKKGIIEVQFNWIFVIIVGFILFLFIISIVLSQRKHSDTVLNAEIVQQLSTTIKGKQQLSNTYNEVDIPNTNIYLSCDGDTGISDLRIESSLRENLPLEIVFGPRTISGNSLSLWTQDFDMPFIVTRFMYITTHDVAFFIYATTVPTTAFAQKVYADLPSNMTKYTGNMAELTKVKNNFKKYKIVCFNNDCPLGESFINIIPTTPATNTIYGYGDVKYHVNGVPPPDPNSKYITKAGFFGTIFSDNKNYYECEMGRATEQFQIKRYMLLKRLNITMDEMYTSPGNDCVPVYIIPQNALNNMAAFAGSNIAAILNPLLLKNLYDAVKQVETGNSDANFKSCASVY